MVVEKVILHKVLQTLEDLQDTESVTPGGDCSKERTVALSVMSFAMVAIFTISAPASYISRARRCSWAADGVPWKSWKDRITLHVVGTSPLPARSRKPLVHA